MNSVVITGEFIFSRLMEFIYPNFLWALAALAIPIILHLFYFRRYKKVLFSNVKFLREVKEETSARNKLRNLLILLMRLLAIAFLVFAFAQPFIPQSGEVTKGKKSVSIFVDNSFSMNSFGEELTLLDQAKQRAEQIVNAYTSEDQIQIITHDLMTKHQRFLSNEDALAAIGEIEISPNVAPLSRVLNRQRQLFEQNQSKNKISYFISDFQESIMDLSTDQDSTIEINLVPVQSVQEKNVAIDSAWFEAPVQMLNQTNLLFLRFTNHSADDIENIKVSIDIDGQEKPLGSINIPAGKSIIDTANITILKTGWHRVIVRITDFPVQFDDTYYLSFYVDENVRVLSINENIVNPNLEAVFRNNSYFTLDNQTINAVNYSVFPQYDLIILNDLQSISSGFGAELLKYMDAGGKAILFPKANVNPENYNQFLKSIPANTFGQYQKKELIAGGINTEEFIFRNVFEGRISNIKLPSVRGYYPLSNLQGRGQERLLSFRNGDSYIVKYGIGSGHLYLSTSPLNVLENDLVRNAEIFVPLLYKSAIATNVSKPNAYTIGQQILIEIENPENDGDRIYTFKGASEFIPGMIPLGQKLILDVNDQVQEAGYYRLMLNNEDQGSYAFNYNREESNLRYLSAKDLKTSFNSNVNVWDQALESNLTQLIGEKDRGVILWKWCIILALLFLALEVLLIRLWKT
jgi:hypothetical protein